MHKYTTTYMELYEIKRQNEAEEEQLEQWRQGQQRLIVFSCAESDPLDHMKPKLAAFMEPLEWTCVQSIEVDFSLVYGGYKGKEYKKAKYFTNIVTERETLENIHEDDDIVVSFDDVIERLLREYPFADADVNWSDDSYGGTTTLTINVHTVTFE